MNTCKDFSLTSMIQLQFIQQILLQDFRAPWYRKSGQNGSLCYVAKKCFMLHTLPSGQVAEVEGEGRLVMMVGKWP